MCFCELFGVSSCFVWCSCVVFFLMVFLNSPERKRAPKKRRRVVRKHKVKKRAH